MLRFYLLGKPAGRSRARHFSSSALNLNNSSGLKNRPSKSFMAESEEDDLFEFTVTKDESRKEEVYSSIGKLLQSSTIQRVRMKEALDAKNLKDISAEEDRRIFEKFKIPISKWKKKVENDIGKMTNADVSGEKISTLLKTHYGRSKGTIRIDDIFVPLDVGDAVEFDTSLNQSIMSVIVEVPRRDDDPRYTVMDRKGILHFLEKSSFKLRIPKVIPKGWANHIVERTNIESSGYGSVKTTVDQQFQLFNVNPVARNIIVSPLLDINQKVWEMLPDVSQKLEIIHRMIQGKGPSQVSLFTLYNAVEDSNLHDFRESLQTKSANQEYSRISKEFSEKFGDEFKVHNDEVLGKGLGSFDKNKEFSIPLLYSIILALRKQNKLWSTSYSSRTAMIPLTVTVNPLEYIHRIESTVDLLKNSPHVGPAFVRLIDTNDFHKIPPEFEDVLFLLKEYAVGNVTDPISETAICQLMKAPKSAVQDNVTKTIVYDLLVKLGYISASMTNPLHFSANLAMPTKGVSAQADQEQDYYDLSSSILDGNYDVSNGVRTDFGNMKVYCIDSEIAHEIDDGVAIERIDEDTVNLHIHIADPASFLKPEETISRIAFERAFTTYQPETISAMLPKSLIELSGLGIEGKKTRTLTFSVPFSLKTQTVQMERAQVRPSYTSKFPKYTYKTVDSTLERTRDLPRESLNDEECDLNDLFHIANKLRAARVNSGAVIFDENISLSVSVLPKGTYQEKSAQIIDTTMDREGDVVFTKQKSTDSQTLVSELMILANSISGYVLSKNNLPGIYKGMNALNLKGSAAELIPEMNKFTKETGKYPSLKKITKSIKFVVPSYYSHFPIRHLMLGIEGYAPSTSPLRRYGDLINHWQFHNLAKGNGTLFTDDQMLYMSLHIESRNDILKNAQRRSVLFYAAKYIKNQLERGIPLHYSFIIWSRPIDRFVSGTIPELGIIARMKLNSDAPPKIGHSVKNFEITLLDPLSGLVELTQL